MFHIYDRIYIDSLECSDFEDASSGSASVAICHPHTGEAPSVFPHLAAALSTFSLSSVDEWLVSRRFKGLKTVFHLPHIELVRLQIALWKGILETPTVENLFWLYETYLKDLKLKVDPWQFPRRRVDRVRALKGLTRIEFAQLFDTTGGSPALVEQARDLGTVSFEYLLASHLRSDTPTISEAFFGKIAKFSWEQIIQEFFVIRAQIVNGLYNNINLLLPEGQKIDESQDIYYQIFGHPYLSWLFDAEFHPNNVEYVRANYDIDIFADLYDNWIKYRTPAGRTPEQEVELDNLAWITNAIKRGDWKHLFEMNLKRDFGCVYVDNHMLANANQIWTALLYREFNQGRDETASRLTLKASLRGSEEGMAR